MDFDYAPEWLPFALMFLSVVLSFIGATVSSVNKLWNAATFFTAAFAVGVASIIIFTL